MTASTPNRTCVEEPTYAAQVKALGIDVARMDAILVGVLAKITRFPERSYVVPGTDLSSEITTAFPGAPVLWMLFGYDEEHVYLRWIHLY